MKTLIVDNYDSFTFNLFQLAAQVLGVEPVVVRNDQVSWADIKAMDIDAIILSPGPGTPHRPGDLGVCADILRFETRPVLGVCLGHQAIAHSLGAGVEIAPEPMHGRLSAVYHDGTGLLRNLPSPFQVVRYHSLTVVEPLPPELAVTARTQDGLIMALSHASRPLWGVQFHPESILSEHGARLIANFRDLAQATAPLTECPIEAVTAPDSSKNLAESSPRILTLRWRNSGVWADPELVFARLFGDSTQAVWLDGSAGRRYSIMAAADDALSRHLTECFDAGTGTITTLESWQGGGKRHDGGMLATLRRILAETRLEFGPEGAPPFPFKGGWLGQLGYESENPGGFRPSTHPAYPDAQFIQPSLFLVFDHQTEHVLVAGLSDDDHQLQPVIEHLHRLAAGKEELPPLPDLAAVPRVPPALAWLFDDTRYGTLIDECQDQLRAGESYEICLTNRIRMAPLRDPFLTLRLLRRLNPAPNAAYLRFGNLRILSASPEQFLLVDDDRHVLSKPIKGTRPRGTTEAEDASLRADLAQNEKDRSENLMIADLLRNDLGSVCEVGSVHVPRLMEVETFRALHQLVTTVAGRLRPGLTAADALAACFPGGSMTGAPKRRTLEIIDRLEATPRGVYSGTIGWIGLDGAGDLNIVIRSMVDDGRLCEIGAGGAIVALSDRDEEIEEIRVKARALIDAVAVTEGILQKAGDAAR